MMLPPDELRGAPFTTRHAEAVGVTRKMLRGPSYVSLHPGRGVWAVADEPRDLAFLLQGDQLILPPDAVVSHETGLRVHGIDIGSNTVRHWSTNGPAKRNSDHLVLHRRRAQLRAIEVNELPVLPAERCLVDAALHLSHRDIVRAGDALAAAGLISPERFENYVWRHRLHGVRRSRRNAPLVREKVDSFRETDLRLVMVHCRLPEPEVNGTVVDESGRFLARCDLVLRRWKIVVEYDGWHHERSAHQRRKDILRREALEAAGWIVIIVTAADLEAPASLVGRVWRALVSRGYGGRAPRFDRRSLLEIWRQPGR